MPTTSEPRQSGRARAQPLAPGSWINYRVRRCFPFNKPVELAHVAQLPHKHLMCWGELSSRFVTMLQRTCPHPWCCLLGDYTLCCGKRWNYRGIAVFITTPSWTTTWIQSPFSSIMSAAGWCCSISHKVKMLTEMHLRSKKCTQPL